MKEISLEQLVTRIITNYLTKLSMDLVKRNFPDEYYSFEEGEMKPDNRRKKIEEAIRTKAQNDAIRILDDFRKVGIKKLEDFENEENESIVKKIISDYFAIGNKLNHQGESK